MHDTERIEIGTIKSSKILVIDDEPVILEIIKKFLSRHGFNDITTLTTFKEGVGYVNTLVEKINHIDLVILDVVLQDGNGFDLCEKIKKEIPSIPVLMISGYEIDKIYEKIVKSKADDFMVKPFDGNELAMRVNLHLHKKTSYVNSFLTIDKDNQASNNLKKIDIKRNCPYIGETLNNYIIIDSLGWSKASAVYKVVDKDTHKLFAMKLIVFPSAEQGELLQRFTTEIDLLSRCDHPHIIQFHEKGDWGDIPYMIMEYFESIDLEEYLVSHGKMPYKPFTKISYQLASALSHIHKNNIIHRDIKLKNILFNPEICEIKIADFGIAKHPDFTSLTRTGYVMGTPMYMPPEVFEGDDATLSSDIYSYGATVYHLLTGVPPYVADRASDLVDSHRQKEPSPLSIFRDDIPKKLADFIVNNCMAKNPDQRPSTMEEVAETVRELSV